MPIGRTRSGRKAVSGGGTVTAIGGGGVAEEEQMDLPTISQTVETDDTFDKLVKSVKVRQISPRYYFWVKNAVVDPNPHGSKLKKADQIRNRIGTGSRLLL